MKLTVEASGAAGPDTVWDRYVHPARWHEWSPQIRSVDYPDPTIADGGRGTVHGPCGVGVAFEILAVDHETRCWTWRVTVAGVTLVLGHDVFAQPSGSRTTLEIAGPAPVVIGYAPIARVALGRLVR
jgi:hypothetical protein